ncbi:MAG: hypothetical protein J6Z27_04975, partial [Bacteroidales bacterium]|nr:hypothetical protein [Bacteroidales bacterium]
MNKRHIRSIVFGLIVLAFVLFLFSFITSDAEHKLSRQVHKTERILHKKQKLLDKYVRQAQDTPVSQWLDFPDFPDDMVLYKYDADTLQSWVNQFSISNDEVDVIPLSYRLHYMSN